jgi:tRNA-binding protein
MLAVNFSSMKNLQVDFMWGTTQWFGLVLRGRCMEGMEASYSDFEKLEIRVGRIIKVEEFPKARKPAYKLWIDFGEFGIRKSSAQITKLYTPEHLQNRLILAVTNFSARQVADFISEVLILGVVLDQGEVVLVQPDQEVPLGKRLL